MIEGIDQSQLSGALEALLFVSDEPVSVMTLATMLEVSELEVQASLEQLQASLQQDNRGIQLREVAGGWRFVTHPSYHGLLERYVASWDTRKLSQAALETLAIVAYCQPVTRNGIASVRGVNSDSSVNSLMEKGLLREVGTQDSPGNPVLYGTTKTFLERFGLGSLSDLEPLDTFAIDDETRAFISQRLNVVTDSPEVIASLEQDDTAPTQQVTREDAMQSLLHETLMSSVGAVEKIDFSQLVFDEDD